MILKHTLVISLSILALKTYAGTQASRESLAKECQDLSSAVRVLVNSQKKVACADQLDLAADQVSFAGSLILENEKTSAKILLERSVYSLQYAELDSCSRYIQISHAKFEAQRIKNSF